MSEHCCLYKASCSCSCLTCHVYGDQCNLHNVMIAPYLVSSANIADLHGYKGRHSYLRMQQEHSSARVCFLPCAPAASFVDASQEMAVVHVLSLHGFIDDRLPCLEREISGALSCLFLMFTPLHTFRVSPDSLPYIHDHAVYAS